MRIILQNKETVISAAVSTDVLIYLHAAARKEENLRHEQRRHWDARGFDEEIILRESNHRYYYESPEQYYLRKETLMELQKALAACMPVQRGRFLLLAIERLSFSEIAKRQGCSKSAVRDSIQAIRKKLQTILKDQPYESLF